MPIPVTIIFTSPGLQPPVYIATSLSDPQWEPIEMEIFKDSSEQYKFSKTFRVQEGEYQYKLRLGPGDWWVCDDSKPQVDDGSGNKNNTVTVKAGEGEPSHERSDSVLEHSVPLMPHESPDKSGAASPFLQSERKDGPEIAGVEHPACFFSHESLASTASHAQEDEDEHEAHSPLLRHEAVAPTHEAVSPLFHHETTAIDDQKHEDHSNKSPLLRGRKHSGDSIPKEADIDEPGLERFPTDHRGILESIARTKKSLPEDQTSESSSSPSPPQRPVARLSPTLTSLTENEQEDVAHAHAVPEVKILESDSRPAAPMTPPMTPTKEKQVNPISERVQDNAHSFKESTKSAAVQAAQLVNKTNYSAVLTGSIFAFAVALTAVGIWCFSESGRYLDVIDP